MVADLQEMQENQRVSEIRIDKSEFIFLIWLLQVSFPEALNTYHSEAPK